MVGDWWPWAGWIAMGAALVVTVVTGLDYVRQAIALRATAMAERAR